MTIGLGICAHTGTANKATTIRANTAKLARFTDGLPLVELSLFQDRNDKREEFMAIVRCFRDDHSVTATEPIATQRRKVDFRIAARLFASAAAPRRGTTTGRSSTANCDRIRCASSSSYRSSTDRSRSPWPRARKSVV